MTERENSVACVLLLSFIIVVIFNIKDICFRENIDKRAGGFYFVHSPNSQQKMPKNFHFNVQGRI